VRALLAAIRSQGGKPAFNVKSGTSDMNLVGPAWGCPMAAYGPGDSELDHTPNEHIAIPDYLAGIDILKEALEALTSDTASEQPPKNTRLTP
jgi:LysW-gamma-L-lysine carboxypeptidase